MNYKIERCPACQSTEIRTIVVADEQALQRYLAYSRIKYDSLLDSWLENIELAIDACDRCGHHWYRNQPSSDMLTEMYTNGRSLNPVNHDSLDRSASQKMVAELGRLNNIISKKSPLLLDYGSGFGRWARAGVSVGFDVTAYEPSVARGNEDEKVDFKLVHHSDEIKGQFFDVINLEQVLEHVPDPFKLVKSLKQYCTETTIVRITVPNILRCPEGVKLWSEWPYDGKRAHTMAPFEHLHGFTPASLRAVAARADLTPVTSFRVLRYYPREVARAFAGKILPSIGQTMLLARYSF